MTNIPTLIEVETVEPMYPRGTGGKPVVIIGDNKAIAPTTNIILKYNDYAAAKQSVEDGGVGVQPVDWIFPLTEDMRAENPLLAAIADVFLEGSIFNTTRDKLGIEYVYAINIRTVASPGALTAGMWTNAMTLCETLPEMEILELYAGCADISVMNSVKTHIKGINGMRIKGLKRTAFFTTQGRIFTPTAGSTIKEDIIALTDAGETTFINDSTIIIHRDPLMQSKFCSKCACTEHGIDPGYGPYRSATPLEIMIVGRTDADDYTGAGIVVDGLSINPDFQGMVEPVMAVSTAFGVSPRPVDSYLHHRFNVDYQSIRTNTICLNMIKKNNTDVARAMAQESCTGFLQSEVTTGNLQAKTTTDDGKPADSGFFIDISIDTLDAFKIVKSMKVRPIGSVHMIEVYEIIQAPVAGGV